ncbi:V-type proton ATPase subunit C [Tanacetum coccineum]
MATRYWIVSLPVKSTTSSSLWTRLQEQISKNSFDTPLYRFNIPNLRVGTLDSLLSLSDDLLKSNTFIEGCSHKIRRQIEDLEKVSGILSSSLTVDGVPVDSYLTKFVWDEAKYPTMSPLKEIVDGIHVQVAKIDDDLKIRIAEYNNVRSQLNAINRKQTGSLAVRDLANIVSPEDLVNSEHLVTLIAVVPKYSQKDWLSSYETLTTYVVPRSSKNLHEDNEYAIYTVTLFNRDADNFRTKARERGFQVPRSSKNLHEDNEYAIYTVTLFNRDADNFRTKARERGFQIRDFEYNSETQESRKQELEKLMQDQESLRSSLLNWCYTSYGEVFTSWMHFCAVRLFAESILRYGLPPSFLMWQKMGGWGGGSVVLSPSVKSEKKVRAILETVSDSSNSTFWKTEDDGNMGSLGGEADAHPYAGKRCWRGCWNKWHEFIGVKVRKWNCFLLTLLTHSRYCMGGALGIASSVFVPEIDAAVAFYGVPPTELADAAKIKQPAQAQFG